MAIRAAWGLPMLRFIDDQGKVIRINASKPVSIETEFFSGVILAMIRCDDEKFDKYNTYKRHFQGTDKKFEIQFQGKLKYIPSGIMMLGGELDCDMKMGYITSMLFSCLISISCAVQKCLKISIGQEAKEDMQYERPHLVFPLFRIMDRVVITKPGEVPPTLGKELPESDEARDLRRNGPTEMQFEEGCIYSFSFHSSFVDFTKWSLCGFPGYNAIDIRRFLGSQEPNIVVYEIDNKDAAENSHMHFMNRKKYLTSIRVTYFPDGLSGEEE